MNPKNTWLLVMLAAGLFAFIYFFERHLKPPAPVVARVLPGLDETQVTSVEIQPRGQFAIRVDRTNGGWMLTKPLLYPVRAGVVDALLKALANLSPETRISAQQLAGNKNVNAAFGFDTPQMTIFIDQGDDEKQLKVGNPTPPGDGLYAQVVGTEGVDIIGTGLLAAVPTDAGQWRDPAFVNLQSVPFDQLAVASTNGRLAFQRDAPGRPWQMKFPGQFRADTYGIDSMLLELQSLAVVQFVTDNPGDLEQYGLQSPPLELTFLQNTNKLLSIQFGKSPTNDASLVYARTNSSGTIVKVPRQDLKHWSDESWQFRDPHLFSLTATEQLGSIACYGPGGQLAYTVQTNGSGAITVTDPQGQSVAAEPGAVSALIQTLVGMNVVQWSPGRFADDAYVDSDLPAMGLAPTPMLRYVIKRAVTNGETPPLLVQLDFGGPNTNSPGTICARRSDPPELSVFAVRSNDVALLLTNAVQLRLRQIWNFGASNVARIKIQLNGKAKEWQRQKENVWLPPSGITDSSDTRGIYLENLADNLGLLQALAWIGPGEPNPAMGFSDNELEISVWLQDPNHNLVERTVSFGARLPGGGFYACTPVDGRNWLFVISDKDVGDIIKYLPRDN